MIKIIQEWDMTILEILEKAEWAPEVKSRGEAKLKKPVEVIHKVTGRIVHVDKVDNDQIHVMEFLFWQKPTEFELLEK